MQLRPRKFSVRELIGKRKQQEKGSRPLEQSAQKRRRMDDPSPSFRTLQAQNKDLIEMLTDSEVESLDDHPPSLDDTDSLRDDWILGRDEDGFQRQSVNLSSVLGGDSYDYIKESNDRDTAIKNAKLQLCVVSNKTKGISVDNEDEMRSLLLMSYKLGSAALEKSGETNERLRQEKTIEIFTTVYLQIAGKIELQTDGSFTFTEEINEIDQKGIQGYLNMMFKGDASDEDQDNDDPLEMHSHKWSKRAAEKGLRKVLNHCFNQADETESDSGSEALDPRRPSFEVDHFSDPVEPAPINSPGLSPIGDGTTDGQVRGNSSVHRPPSRVLFAEAGDDDRVQSVMSGRADHEDFESAQKKYLEQLMARHKKLTQKSDEEAAKKKRLEELEEASFKRQNALLNSNFDDEENFKLPKGAAGVVAGGDSAVDANAPRQLEAVVEEEAQNILEQQKEQARLAELQRQQKEATKAAEEARMAQELEEMALADAVSAKQQRPEHRIEESLARLDRYFESDIEDLNYLQKEDNRKIKVVENPFRRYRIHKDGQKLWKVIPNNKSRKGAKQARQMDVSTVIRNLRAEGPKPKSELKKTPELTPRHLVAYLKSLPETSRKDGAGTSPQHIATFLENLEKRLREEAEAKAAAANAVRKPLATTPGKHDDLAQEHTRSLTELGGGFELADDDNANGSPLHTALKQANEERAKSLQPLNASADVKGRVVESSLLEAARDSSVVDFLSEVMANQLEKEIEASLTRLDQHFESDKDLNYLIIETQKSVEHPFRRYRIHKDGQKLCKMIPNTKSRKGAKQRRQMDTSNVIHNLKAQKLTPRHLLAYLKSLPETSRKDGAGTSPQHIAAFLKSLEERVQSQSFDPATMEMLAQMLERELSDGAEEQEAAANADTQDLHSGTKGFLGPKLARKMLGGARRKEAEVNAASSKDREVVQQDAESANRSQRSSGKLSSSQKTRRRRKRRQQKRFNTLMRHLDNVDRAKRTERGTQDYEIPGKRDRWENRMNRRPLRDGDATSELNQAQRHREE